MIKKLFLIALLSLSANHMFANATDDLFTAIEQGDIAEVETALANGADVMHTRTSDNHTPYSLARAIHENYAMSLTVAIPALATLGIFIAAIKHNPKVGIASLATTLIGDFSSKALAFGGLAVATATALKSKHTALTSVGIAGFIINQIQRTYADKKFQIVALIVDAVIAQQRKISEENMTAMISELPAQEFQAVLNELAATNSNKENSAE